MAVKRLSIDPDRCVGHGRCYELAPGLVRDDDWGHGEVVVSEPGADQLPAAQEAVNSCPEHAVHLTDG